jgi:UDP-N-acetyl-D-glucosamine dehydrogenase
MRVSIIGQGYVGQNLAMSAASVGHKIIGVDKNSDLIGNLKNGVSFVPGIEQSLILKLITDGFYLPTDDFKLIETSDVVVIAVPTPLDKNRQPDLTALIEACKSIKKFVAGPTLIISESTSYPGTLRNIIKSHAEPEHKSKFLFAVAPERVDPGNAVWGIRNTPRVLSGLNYEATQKAKDFYSSFCSEIVEVSSPEVAEASKLLENTFRQVNIALINEFSEIMKFMEISANEVVKAANTKPFGFMQFLPGIGVGGHCIPVDPEYLTFFAKNIGANFDLINLANKLNFNRPIQVAERVSEYLGTDSKGKKIQIAGITYKAGVSDMRESPAISLIIELRKLGFNVKWHDPLILKWGDEESEALDSEVDLGLVVSPHKEINFEIWKKSGRTVLDLSIGHNNLGWPKIL